MDKTSIDLSKPAFGPGSQKLEESAEEPKQEPVQQEEEAKVEEQPVQEEPQQEEPEEPARVPYSRFKKYHDRARELEEEVAQLKAKREPETKEELSEVPSWWSQLYGDSEPAKQAWRIQEKANQQLIEEARTKALEAVELERIQESQRVSENEERIDSELESLNEYAGRTLTEKEQSELLDIVDEYTPKDKDGNYLGATIPFEKAWDIHEMQQQLAKKPQKQSRDKVAELTGSQTKGEPSAEVEERNKAFNPLDWGAWKKRM